MLIGSLVGMVVAGYLAATQWLATSSDGCEVGSECSLLHASYLASPLGIPPAAWGFALYGALALVAVFVRNARRHSRLSLGLTGVGLAVSAYLIAVSGSELHAVCWSCIASFGLMTACFAIAVAQMDRGKRGLEIGAIAVGSVILVSTLHLFYGGRISSAARTEVATLRALALHLNATGARFYGASWCQPCNDQKALFGEAASLLPYVECTPEGRRQPQASACRERRIERYPTWIIGSHRREGLLDIETLAALSRFLSSESSPMRDRAVQGPAAPGKLD